MRRYLMPMAAALVASTALPTAASAQDAVTTVYINMRAGPSTAFPVVDVIPSSEPVDVHGCVSGYSWCDVSAAGARGWVYADYLSYARGGSYVPLVQYAPEIDLPIIAFSVGSYWDTYYRDRPWYGERVRWGNRWRDNWRDIRRDYRVDRRRDRREDRVDRRQDRREAVRDRRRDARSEAREERRERVQERRRDNRVERREQRRDVRERRRESRSERRGGNRGARVERRERSAGQRQQSRSNDARGRQGRSERGGGRRGREG